NESTNVARVVVTDSAGLYSVPNLLPGAYRVEASVPGFQQQTKAGLVLTIGQTLTANFAVQPGEQKQSVQVVARAEQLLQTATSSLGGVIEQHEIRDLPLNGRDFTTLFALNAGVQTAPQGAKTMNINGARGAGNAYLIDGLDISSRADQNPFAVPNLEAIGEFRIITNSFSAEYGRAMGGVINAHI